MTKSAMAAMAMAFVLSGCGDSVPQAKGAPKPEVVPGAKAIEGDGDAAPPAAKKS